MPSKPLSRRLSEVARRYGAERYVSLALEVAAPDGRILIRAGGVWDRVLCKFDRDQEPTYARVQLVSSQVKAAEQLAEWFEAYDRDDPKRKALEVYVDNRRGGKTFFTVLAVVLFCLRYPFCHLGSTLGWIVVPAFSQQREIHKTLGDICPPEWFQNGAFRHHRKENWYQIITGAQLWIKSADRPHLLKQGGVSVVGINEAQQISDEGILNALGANIDSGGICFTAMNPPDKPIGLWAENLHDAVDARNDKGELLMPFARETPFPAAKNEVIDQDARSRFAAVAAVINPKKAQRDVLGFWTAIKDRAYPHWRRAEHVQLPPDWRDITREVTGLTGKLMAGETRPLVGGMDFQHRPYCCFVEVRVFEPPGGGPPVYFVTYECTNDIARGEWWYEELLCNKVIAAGKTPADYLLIADATGRNQGASGAQRGKEADPETFSFPILERYGFEPHGPIENTMRHYVPRRGTEVKTAHINPPVPVRLNLMNRLLAERRLFVSPHAPETAEAFRMCEAKNKKPWGKGAHLTDSVGYPVYALETALIQAGVVTNQLEVA